MNPRRDEEYLLRLYVTGTTHRSAQAIANMLRWCEERLYGRYRLEVVDIYQHPEFLADDRIVAAPTLVRIRPGPRRLFVGDLTDGERILEDLVEGAGFGGRKADAAG